MSTALACRTCKHVNDQVERTQKFVSTAGVLQFIRGQAPGFAAHLAWFDYHQVEHFVLEKLSSTSFDHL